MNDPRLRVAAAAIGLCVLGGVLAGCGSGTITIGGGGGGNGTKVTFTGTIDAVSPVTTRNIVAFVYKFDNSDNTDRCPCPPNQYNTNSPQIPTVGKAAVLASGTTTFTVSGLDPGKFGVVFLLDHPGTAADSEIDPGDEIAVLDDINCALDSVSGNITVTLDKVDIAFSSPGSSTTTLAPSTTTTTTTSSVCEDGVGDPPYSGRARANKITLTTTPPAN